MKKTLGILLNRVLCTMVPVVSDTTTQCPEAAKSPWIIFLFWKNGPSGGNKMSQDQVASQICHTNEGTTVETSVRSWIAERLPARRESLANAATSTLHELLKDGTLLCEYVFVSPFFVQVQVPGFTISCTLPNSHQSLFSRCIGCFILLRQAKSVLYTKLKTPSCITYEPWCSL